MSGEYNGLQALFNDGSNNLATWIPCFTHSLNLVGTDSIKCCLEAKLFFDFCENIYVFFTSSTDRFNKLTIHLKKSNPKKQYMTPKRVSTTRWSSRKDSVFALSKNYITYKEVFFEMSIENDEAKGLLKRLSKLETARYIIFWNDILVKFDKISKKLQSVSCDLNTSIVLLKALKNFVQSKREKFTFYESEGKKLSGCDKYEYEKSRQKTPNRRLNPLDYAQTPDVQHAHSDKFRIESYLPVIDQITVSLTNRIDAYKNVSEYFGFLSHLDTISDEEIEESSKKLIEKYQDDLEDSLTDELIQFKEFVKEFLVREPAQDYDNDEDKDKRKNNKDKKAIPKLSYEARMYKLIIDKSLKEIFPNVETLIKIYLVIMTTNCTCERAFSKLKIILSRLRVSMKEERLNSLTLLNIEHDILDTINFSEIIDDFAERKIRKVSL